MENQYRKTNFIYLCTIILLFAMAAFNVFYHLGTFPIYSWDEARHGVSAYEMLKKGNFIVNTYRYQNDYWNLKPPLSFLAIIAGYKLAGFNALGLRIFSACFALFTIIMAAAFVYKKYGRLASVLVLSVLSTSTQFLTNHSSRTGDADSLFVCLFTLAVLSLLLSTENHRWLYISGAAFAFAFLTKSWHAGNIAVIMALYLFFTGKYKRLSNRNWILLVVSMLLPILLWGIIRYQYDGFTFFKGMILYDLLHRSSTTIEGHIGGISYYYYIFIRYFLYWLLTICLFVFIFLFNKNRSLRQWLSSAEKEDLIGIILWIFVPFILFTIAKTKIRWYILPIYPALSVFFAILASKILLKGKWWIRVLLGGAILFTFAYYESNIYQYVSSLPPNPKQDLIEKTREMPEIKGSSLYLYQQSRKTTWLQSDVLTAELSDDLRVKNGGWKGFLQTNKALLLIPKNLYSNSLLKTNGLKLIASNQWGYLVCKNG